jgi:signal transduction histidine kinase
VNARRLVPLTLRARLSLLAAAAVFGVLLLAGTGLVLAQREILVDALDDTMVAQTRIVADRLAAGERIQRSVLISDEVSLEVVAEDGQVLAAVADDAGPLPSAPEGDGGGGTVVLEDGPARLMTTEDDGVTIRVAASLEDVSESTGALVAALAVAVPATTAVLAGLVWWVVGRALQPVERIRERVHAIGSGAADHRVPEPAGPEEIARLARTMNAMLARLQESAERQRRFVADASHELRSPLARMRAEMEVDATHPESAEPSLTAASVLAETVSLQRLVDDLLLLARGDAGAGTPAAVPVDLDEVVAGPVARARADGAQVDTSAVRPVQVSGSPGQLERLVTNLVDNAVRHARNGVTVTLTESDGAAVLAVADDGPGIEPGDADRVFERFTRLDEARSSGHGGAGLGLAIARDIAARHGGTLELDASSQVGARFVVRLPTCTSGLPAADPG